MFAIFITEKGASIMHSIENKNTLLGDYGRVGVKAYYGIKLTTVFKKEFDKR